MEIATNQHEDKEVSFNSLKDAVRNGKCDELDNSTIPQLNQNSEESNVALSQYIKENQHASTSKEAYLFLESHDSNKESIHDINRMCCNDKSNFKNETVIINPNLERNNSILEKSKNKILDNVWNRKICKLFFAVSNKNSNELLEKY